MFSQIAPGLKGMTAPQRLMSRTRPVGILARIMILTLVLLVIAYMIFGIVQAATSDRAKLFQGKLIMLSVCMMVGGVLGLVITPIAASIRREIDMLID